MLKFSLKIKTPQNKPTIGRKSIFFFTKCRLFLKGFATFWEFSFYGQKKVADYEYHSLFAEKIHFHT